MIFANIPVKYKYNMIEFFKDNAAWITPILVAIVGGVISGIFSLLKKGGNNNKQIVKNVQNSSVTQINGDSNECR